MFNPRILSNEAPTTPNANGYGSHPRFQKAFNSMLAKQGGAKKKASRGTDMARGLGQAKASVAGRNNRKRTPLEPRVDPLVAAMQHTVRNRSQEQASNASNITQSPAAGRDAHSSVARFLGLQT
jgi:hypothetical protein